MNVRLCEQADEIHCALFLGVSKSVFEPCFRKNCLLDRHCDLWIVLIEHFSADRKVADFAVAIRHGKPTAIPDA